MNLTENQLHILRHMLGINTPYASEPTPHRNYAAVCPGDLEFIELEKIGAVEIYSRRGEYHWYRCTEAGKLAAIRSHRTIRKTKAQRKYWAYLGLCDCIPDLTFKEFLTNPEFKRIIQEA